jgi:hypothetical protein
MRRNRPTDKIFPIVLSADEHAEIRIAAARARKTMSDYVRERVLGLVKTSEATETAADAEPSTPTAPSIPPRTPPERLVKRSFGGPPPPILNGGRGPFRPSPISPYGCAS